METELSREIVPGSNGEILRTILKKDVKDRLTLFAKSLSTGMDKWDYGVAIERLLDDRELIFQIDELKNRIEELELKDLEKEQEEQDDGKKVVELFGGNKERI